ncbi:MAG: thioredoxin domain-containing protein [Cyclobacteriaceae bacterium]
MIRLTHIIIILTALLLVGACQRNNSTAQNDNHEYTNALINETSPYLLQHAHNPVNWYPWNEAVLKKAQKDDKLLVVSVGYSSCHWCHVMEHESFSDTSVANIMNESFISIKVDREERPDIDKVYMDAAMMINGRGGWPLNVIALPDGRPVFAGTYYPKDNWLEILEFFQNAYAEDKSRLMAQADNITNGIKSLDVISRNQNTKGFKREEYLNHIDQMLSNIDRKWGGRSGAPKFPTPVVYEALLAAAYYNNNESAKEAVELTLHSMSKGGIYDHLAGGFVRYSTDRFWKVPHFEKMLYDNAQLIGLYSQAYRLSGNEKYRTVVYETFDWLISEMSDEAGGFYSSIDADSEGGEGNFYVWTATEIDSLLGQEASIFKEFYNVSSSGNWEKGKSILHTNYDSFGDFSEEKGTDSSEDSLSLMSSRAKLLKHRNSRIRPGTDDKVLTSWNSLMISGLINAYLAFNDELFLNKAIEIGLFIVDNQLLEGGHLMRSYKNGQSSVNGFLDDYSLTISAFITLYEATFDESWLYKAKQLNEYVLAHFLDSRNQMFYFNADEDDNLITRKTETTDNVIPSSNSIMAKNLLKLGLYFTNDTYIEHARQMLANMESELEQNAWYYANWVSLMGNFTHPYYEVAIVGESHKNHRNELLQAYLPNVLVLGGSDEGSLDLLKNKLVDGRTMIYVCENKTCKLPVDQPLQAKQLIKVE